MVGKDRVSIGFSLSPPFIKNLMISIIYKNKGLFLSCEITEEF